MNKYLKAFVGLTLVTAALHMVILLLFALVKADVTVINYFNIMRLDLFLPSVGRGWFYTILSGIIAFIIYLSFLLFFIIKKKV
jgi:hypothetical protein